MKKKVIGIFEDDPVNRFTYQQLFNNRKDVEVHIFGNPESGIVLAGEINFDIIFIEIHFWENFGGISILTKLKETSSAPITFIAMASLLQQGDLERVFSSGFSMCVEKPVIFSEMDLLAV